MNMIKKRMELHSFHISDADRSLINDAIDGCIRWLTLSGIRLKASDSPCNGGYFNLYDAGKKLFPMIYSEITAYAVQFWIRTYEWKQDEQYLEIACQTGDFLKKSVNLKASSRSIATFPYGFFMPEIQRIERYFSFDNAICISALVDLYSVTQESSYLEYAVDAGRWLLQMQRQDGSFDALSTPNNENPDSLPIIEGWFGNRSTLNAKNAIGLLKLYNAVNDDSFLVAAKRVLSWTLLQQNKDGSFRAEPENDYIFTHSHCYVLEALIYSAGILNSEDLLQSAYKGAFWMEKVQNKDGAMYKYYGKNLYPLLRQIPRSHLLKGFIAPPRENGPTAQAARIWLILFQLTGNKSFYLAMLKALKYLIERQSLCNTAVGVRGGIPSYSRKFFGRYWNSHIYSSWEAMFACHLFIMYSAEMKSDTDESINIF